MKRLYLVLVILALSIPLSAQETGDMLQGFSAGIILGSDLLPADSSDPSVLESWSKLGFQPDFSIGKFGVGLDFTIRFKLYPDAATPVKIYEPDWIPQNGQTIFDVYLPKIMYVRYGVRGADPFYAKLGSISDFTLGNGLIVSDYANTRFLPETRIFGLQVGVDGSLFKFPYVGFEALTGNLSKLDVIGGRVYVRPLAFLDSSILGRIQVGATAAFDQNPLLYIPDSDIASYPPKKLIYVAGADVTVPIVTGDIFSLTAFVEGARELNEAMGAVVGVGGKLVGFIDYGAQVRYLQQGFIPSYFDTNYDLYRADRFNFIETAAPGDFVPGWLASLGFNLFNKKLAIGALLDGPFAAIPESGSAYYDNGSAYPHLRGSLLLREGMVSGLSFEGGYEKYFIGRNGPFFNDLVDPTDAIIDFAVHYRMGATVLTLDYAYRWDPSADDWDVSSSLSAEVRF